MMLPLLAFVNALIALSHSLNPLHCNGIVFIYNGQISAQPAGLCQADTYSYLGYDPPIPNYSFGYFCEGGSVYVKQWHTNTDCSGTPDYNTKMSDEITSPKNKLYDKTNWIEECGLNECLHIKVTSYHPFDTSSDIYSNKDSCDAWTPTPLNSGYFEQYHILEYCVDYLSDYGISYQYACTSLNGGAVASYNYEGVSDCTGDGTLTFSAWLDGKCFEFKDNSGNPYYNRQDYQCIRPTPGDPVTELPCNAVEFDWDGGTVSYPVNVCIYDKTNSQTVLFYCDGTEFKFKIWDGSSTCVGRETYNGASFDDYLDQLFDVQAQYGGSYTTECSKSECDYVRLKDYTYTGDCDAFTPTDSTEYTETYFIRDYCLAIDDGIDVGSLVWGCDVLHGFATWMSYDGVTDCSNTETLSWVEFGNDLCLHTTLSTKYIDVQCETAPVYIAPTYPITTTQPPQTVETTGGSATETATDAATETTTETATESATETATDVPETTEDACTGAVTEGESAYCCTEGAFGTDITDTEYNVCATCEGSYAAGTCCDNDNSVWSTLNCVDDPCPSTPYATLGLELDVCNDVHVNNDGLENARKELHDIIIKCVKKSVNGNPTYAITTEQLREWDFAVLDSVHSECPPNDGFSNGYTIRFGVSLCGYDCAQLNDIVIYYDSKQVDECILTSTGKGVENIGGSFTGDTVGDDCTVIYHSSSSNAAEMMRSSLMVFIFGFVATLFV